MNIFSIKDLEVLTGVKAHTIRIWEQRYSFLKPNRTDTRIRYYSNAELKTILNISLLNRYGYRISEIDKMGNEEISKKIVTLTHIEAYQDRIVNDLINNTIDMEIENFDIVLDSYISQKGIEITIKRVIFPFLEKIGILWQTNHINPAQEHLVTNIIRNKLVIGIESVKNDAFKKKSALLFLPEGEYHEICLLYLHYILKVNGMYVLYLGANIPLKDVAYLVDIKKPDYIYSHLTSMGSNFNMERFLSKAESILGKSKLMLTGPLTQSYRKDLPNNIEIMKSLSEVIKQIENVI
jgi:DNA-binding transcriptional MerR regulator